MKTCIYYTWNCIYISDATLDIELEGVETMKAANNFPKFQLSKTICTG